MRALVIQQGRLEIEDIAEPEPTSGQVLVRTITCGICGTDLHARNHMHHFIGGMADAGQPLPVDPDGKVVFGHEFCAEVLDYAPGETGRLPRGSRVVAIPFVKGPQGKELVGYSNRFPGGFADRMVLTEKLLIPVPNGLSSVHAALTEPFSVGAHAVERGAIQGDVVIMVVGCGPIGLAVIAALKARGLGPVIAADFSPGRRRFAEKMGADEVFDPAVEEAASVWSRHGAGRRGKRAIAFECVGRPGVVQSMIESAPRQTKMVVVGNSLEPSTIDQVMAFNKELDLCFTTGYTEAEFERTLHDLAEGRIPADTVVTDIVPLEATAAAFNDLTDPERHAKIIIDLQA